MAEKRTQKSRQANTPVWEWVFAAIGFCLVVASISTFLYRGFSRSDSRSHFSVTTKEVSSRDGIYSVPFSIKNLGSETAASLTIEGTLKQGEQTVETSSVSLTYVPANSEREGILIFSMDPAAHTLQVRPMGYEKP